MRKFLLLILIWLCGMTVMANVVVNFQVTNKPAVLADLVVTADGNPITSGASVADNATVKFTAAVNRAWHVEWYMNEQKVENDLNNVLEFKATADCTVEARYVENFKFIFEGTPHVKYAAPNGVIYLGQNYYCHKFEKLRAFGYTVTSYKGSNGKTYSVDRSKNPDLIVKDTLKADVVMTPNYSLNESDFGDATVVPVWDFGKPDSVALFRNFQGRCCFVMPTFFDSNYVDLNMVCDATYGWIDNENNQDLGYAEVGAGTKFTLPARYGTIYRMVTKEPLSATTIADSTSAQYKTTQDAKGNYVASLLYYVSEKDSIQIDVKEDIKLVAISASYPGSDNFMTWMPDTATVKNELLTLRKPEGAGSLLFDVTDLTVNGGLKVEAGEPLDSLTAQIEVPQEFDENKYVSVGFKMAEGFSYLHGKCVLKMRIYDIKTSAKVQVVMSDTKGNRLESRLYEYNNLADSVLIDTLANAVQPVYMEGLVTMKIYVYGDAANYRLYMTIDSKGEVCEILRFPEGYTFTPTRRRVNSTSTAWVC